MKRCQQTLLRALLIASLVPLYLGGCSAEQLSIASDNSRSRAALLPAGLHADAVVFQTTERANASARTTLGGFAAVRGVAAGDDYLWIADGNNNRVLGFQGASGLLPGADADMVVNQADGYTSDHQAIPSSQRLQHMGVATDADKRLYVHSNSAVLVYEDPFAVGSDAIADYALTGLPAGSVRNIRTVAGMITVVSSGGIQFYEPGSAEPLGRYAINVPCAGSVQDVAWTGSYLLVGCGGAGGIYLYNADPTTGFVSPNIYTYVVQVQIGTDPTTGAPIFGPETRNATPFTGFGSLTAMMLASDALFVADGSAGNRVLRFKGVDAHIAALFADPQNFANKLPINADLTFGQINGDDANRACNLGAPAPSSSSLCNPDRLWISGDRLWVADAGNNRVTTYVNASTTTGSAASLVLGQPNFSGDFPNRLEADSVANISGVAISKFDDTKVFSADPAANRVLGFDAVLGLSSNNVIDAMGFYGQSDPDTYMANSPSGSVTQRGLAQPSYVAVEPNTGYLYVSDSGNQRIVVFQTDDLIADRVIGTTDLSTPGSSGYGYGALAVRDQLLFVAVGTAGGGAANRVFMYDLSIGGQIGAVPDRIFGQGDDSANGCNRGGVRADSLCGVQGVAVDADGRLWVADSSNRRVLWFDAPNDADAIAATTADGVVGQPEFTSNGAWGGVAGPNAYGFNLPTGIDIDDNGVLWVADTNASRVVAYPTPRIIDQAVGMARAATVVGQPSLAQQGSNYGGISAATLSNPVDVAVDSSGRIIVIADQGNHRMLRFIDNAAPVISGAGQFEVAAGSSITIDLGVTDPDGDPVGPLTLLHQPATVTITGSSITYNASEARPGDVMRLTVFAADQGPRNQVGNASLTIQVVAPQQDNKWQPQQGKPRAADPASDGCNCSGGAAIIPWLMAPLWLWRRRRS